MEIIEKTQDQKLPFSWIDLENLSKSKCRRKEIYLDLDSDETNNMILFFYSLFMDYKQNLSIYMLGQWGDFCIDTWDINKNTYDYSQKNKSFETQSYLSLLINSKIDFNYNGVCKCNDWDKFLSVILPCIMNHKAIYSPLLYDVKNDFLFYFHHTRSIGLLYQSESDAIRNILNRAKQENYYIV